MMTFDAASEKFINDFLSRGKSEITINDENYSLTIRYEGPCLCFYGGNIPLDKLVLYLNYFKEKGYTTAWHGKKSRIICISKETTYGR